MQISHAGLIIPSNRNWDCSRGDRMLEQARLPDLDQEDLAAAGVARPVAPRLLVIDDDHLHRMIICRVAAKAGYTAGRSGKLRRGRRSSCRRSAFDCITLDLSLGQHAGVEMLRHLWVIGCKAPIIIISGCDERDMPRDREGRQIAQPERHGNRSPSPLISPCCVLRSSGSKPSGKNLLRFPRHRVLADRPAPANAAPPRAQSAA